MKNCCVYASSNRVVKPAVPEKCSCKTCCDRAVNRDCQTIEENNYGSGSELSTDWSSNGANSYNQEDCWEYYCKDNYDEDISMYDSVAEDASSVMSYVNSSDEYSCKCQDCGMRDKTYQNNKSGTTSEAGSAELDKSAITREEETNTTSEPMSDFTEEHSSNANADQLTTITETEIDTDHDEKVSKRNASREMSAFELAKSKFNGCGNQFSAPCNKQTCKAFTMQQRKPDCPDCEACTPLKQRDNSDNSCCCQKQSPLNTVLFKRLMSNQSNHICHSPTENQMPKRSCLKKTCAHFAHSPNTCSGKDNCANLANVAKQQQTHDPNSEPATTGASNKPDHSVGASSKTSRHAENQDPQHGGIPGKIASERHGYQGRQSEELDPHPSPVDSQQADTPAQKHSFGPGKLHSEVYSHQRRESEKSGLYHSVPGTPHVDVPNIRQSGQHYSDHQNHAAGEESPFRNSHHGRHSNQHNSRHRQKSDHHAPHKASAENHEIHNKSSRKSAHHANASSKHTTGSRASHRQSMQHHIEMPSSYEDAMEREIKTFEYTEAIQSNQIPQTQHLYYTHTGEPVNILKRVSPRRNQQLPVSRIDESFIRSSGSLPNIKKLAEVNQSNNQSNQDDLEYYLSNQDSYQGLTPVQEVSKEESTIANSESNDFAVKTYNTGSPRFQNTQENNVAYYYQPYVPVQQRHMQFTTDDIQVKLPQQRFNSVSLYSTPIRSSISAAARKWFAHSYPLKRRPNSPRRDGLVKNDRK